MYFFKVKKKADVKWAGKIRKLSQNWELEAAHFGSGTIWKRCNLEARSDPSGPPYLPL